jgi:hypothetical protein
VPSNRGIFLLLENGRDGIAIALNGFAGRRGLEGFEMNRGWQPAFLLALIFVNLAFSPSARGQVDSIYRLPAGTRIRLRLDADISSRFSSVNDTFVAFVTRPVTLRGVVVLPVGTEIEGRVTEVGHSGVAGQDGVLGLAFETLKLGEATRRIDGIIADASRPRTSRRYEIASILGGIAGGAIIGGLTRGKAGAAIGAAIGAGAGTGVALIRKGKEARLRKDEEFEIELRREVVLPVTGY